MKISQYNTTLRVGHFSLLYNALNDCFLCVKDPRLSLTRKLVSDLQERHSQLFQQLLSGGFILPEEVSEFDKLRQAMLSHDNDPSLYTLHINPTLDCNFKCWYCYEKHIPKSVMSSNKIHAVCKLIDTILAKEGLKQLAIGFFGGEPLLYFCSVAKPIIQHANAACATHHKSLSIHFTSNGSLVNDAITEFLSQFNCQFQITLDGNRDDHNATRFFTGGRPSYDIIVANIKRLLEHGIEVLVRINYTVRNQGNLSDILDSFIAVTHKSRLKFDFQCVWQDKQAHRPEVESQIEALRKAWRREGFQVVDAYVPNNLRASCYGDKTNHILVNYDGWVYGCTARDFTRENAIGYLENSGALSLISSTYNARLTAKLKKPICHSCRIAPLCCGGCKQAALESGDSNACTFGYTSEDMDNIVLHLFENLFLSR